MITIRMTPERLDALRQFCATAKTMGGDVPFFDDVEALLDDWEAMIALIDELTEEA